MAQMVLRPVRKDPPGVKTSIRASFIIPNIGIHRSCSAVVWFKTENDQKQAQLDDFEDAFSSLVRFKHDDRLKLSGKIRWLAGPFDGRKTDLYYRDRINITRTAPPIMK